MGRGRSEERKREPWGAEKPRQEADVEREARRRYGGGKRQKKDRRRGAGKAVNRGEERR